MFSFHLLKQFNSKTRDGFTVNSKVPSMKDLGKEYDGFTITITGDRYEETTWVRPFVLFVLGSLKSSGTLEKYSLL